MKEEIEQEKEEIRRMWADLKQKKEKESTVKEREANSERDSLLSRIKTLESEKKDLLRELN